MPENTAERRLSVPFTWPAHTFSPRPPAAPSSELEPLQALCAGSDAALESVAARLARRRLLGGASLDVAEITFALRAEGSPYVWPRAWMLEGPDAVSERARERMQAWLATFDGAGELRCGLAHRSTSNGRDVLVVVAARVLGELRPFPTRARVGQWLELRAELLVPADDAKVVVLGPRGAPRALPTSLDGSQIVARFSADREGAWLVQVMAAGEGGPRPILEAMTFAGVEPDASFTAARAPGEERATADGDRSGALARMIDGARAGERLASLKRAPELDEIAQAHADAMRDAGRIAHDLGDGDPKTRAERRGIGARAIGENVAHAADVIHAHRALWRSPSHRGNMLDPRFDAVGIGVAEGADGSVWVCEVFADF